VDYARRPHCNRRSRPLRRRRVERLSCQHGTRARVGRSNHSERAIRGGCHANEFAHPALRFLSDVCARRPLLYRWARGRHGDRGNTAHPLNPGLQRSGFAESGTYQAPAPLIPQAKGRSRAASATVTLVFAIPGVRSKHPVTSWQSDVRELFDFRVVITLEKRGGGADLDDTRHSQFGQLGEQLLGMRAITV
jgi:hypothetical protein